MKEIPTVRCFSCSRAFQFGMHIYDGKRIPKYQIDVCSSCYQGNWDGWNPVMVEPRLLAHLEAKGLPIPPRNEKDLLPRD